MNRIQVKSGNLRSIGFDSSTRILEIEFINREIFEYYGVSSHIHDELMGASSHGEYFAAKIKNNYPWKKISKIK